ncbi:MAG: 2Fe-2S iron-sulfur cluster binding domain-containing protein [Aromatoleum sp.]|nr:2Fe-2S iron-sulfur cluster binding domain-containing protein [Aromatoleum sp.]
MLKVVQRVGQTAFLAAERVFNRVFGDALNPFYYLGAIAYYLLWVVVASGLYLYIFFATGVHEAYASVEALTHDQWWAGGIMRSFHRYASDAMVLAMVLHLVRHFVFDHYRSFRWFSWISGVILLWLVYIAGINGYMLPWDRTAQFVTVATAEWLDWLPVFNGALIRNFITPDAVNDRLFSLLSFLHIGLPLGTLGLLWIHTQRVPGARTHPPRPVWIGVTLALLVLSLVKPALSGDPADLASAPTTVAFDWFYLTVYPLLYRWSPGGMWALVGILTLLLLILPWLPPKRRAKDDFHLMVRPDNRIVPARQGETILEAVLREGIAFPYECRNGGCGQCKCAVSYGSVEQGPHQESALSAAERAKGVVLACSAMPLSDVELEYVPRSLPGGIRAREYRARVASMQKATDDVMIVRLKVDGDPIRFYPGQYINVCLPDGQRRSFSFATAPHVNDEIELQIRLIPGGQFTTHVFTEMKVGDTIRFEGPLGSFFLRDDSDKPILFVAGATGFAPVKSMVEHAFHVGMKRRMILYWGVRSRRDLYLPDLPKRWAAEHPNFTFVPVLSAPAPEDRWTGRTGLVHEAILADFPDLGGHQIYACGSVKMVEAAHPAFMAHGMTQDDCFSDAFKLTPHLARKAGAADLVKLGGA